MMFRAVLFALVCLLFSARTLCAAEPLPLSVMFTDMTALKIEASIAKSPFARKASGVDLGRLETLAVDRRLDYAESLYLSAILHTGEDDWTIWINERRFDPEILPRTFDIEHVTPEFVILRVAEKPVRLKPNQTWIAGRNTVVEGRLK